jgi:hypothetical protein
MIGQEHQQKYMPDSYAHSIVGVPKDEDLKTALKNLNVCPHITDVSLTRVVKMSTHKF